MKSKFFLTVFLLLTLVMSLFGNTSLASAEAICDAAFVVQAGNVFMVSPTGVDDTVNLQCAFDAAILVGEGARVQLRAGTFHVGQVVINGFHGAFAGAGAKATIITNLPDLPVTPVDFYLAPPSTENPWPGMLAFVNGSYSVSDLAIQVKGNSPTTGWTIYGIDPPLKELALAIAVLGTEAHVKVNRVQISGEPMENTMYGYNLINGIYFEGFMGESPLQPISGSFEVYNSSFSNMASGTPIFNVTNAVVILSKNQYSDVFDASDAGDLVNTSVVFSHNRIDGAEMGYWRYTNSIEDTNTKFLLSHNLIQAVKGIYFESQFGEGNECLIKKNNVQKTTEIGIYLGPGTNGCVVIGDGHKTTVQDLGTGNILIGVNTGKDTGPHPHHRHWPK
jgi:hypothetical protein